MSDYANTFLQSICCTSLKIKDTQ